MKHFSKFWIYLVVAMALSLAVACGGGTEPAAPAASEAPTETSETMPEEEHADGEEHTEVPEEVAMADRCGDKTKLAAEINFYNWADYVDEEILTAFEEECGVKVNLDVYSSNEDLIAKLQAGNSGYDLVVPSDYAVEIMIERGMIKELDFANIPNFQYMNPANLGLYYDPDNKYSVPYQWGTTGIAFNTAFFEEEPDSWAYLFDPALVCEHSGFASMLDDERESVGAALKYLGYSYNDTDPAHHQEARDLLLAQKECLAGYNSDNFSTTLAGEEVVIAHAWSGGAALARDENENIKFVIPKEGGAIWQDNLAVPSDAPNPYTAEVFINYLLDPDVGAQNTNYIYYFTPNSASEPLLDEYYFNLLNDGGMMVDDAVYGRLEWIERTAETIIFSDTWTAVKAR